MITIEKKKIHAFFACMVGMFFGSLVHAGNRTTCFLAIEGKDDQQVFTMKSFIAPAHTTNRVQRIAHNLNIDGIVECINSVVINSDSNSGSDLSIKFIKIDGCNIAHIMSRMDRSIFSNVVSLDFDQCSENISMTLAAIYKYCKNCPNLKFLNLYACGLRAREDFEPIHQAFPGLMVGMINTKM